MRTFGRGGKYIIKNQKSEKFEILNVGLLTGD